MARVTVWYEPEFELLTVFWQAPRPDQVCSELDDGVVLIKDSNTGQPIGIEVLTYRPDDTGVGSALKTVGTTPSETK